MLIAAPGAALSSGRIQLKRLFKELLDPFGLRLANGAACLLRPLEADQGALQMRAKAAHQLLLRVEIYVENLEFLEARIRAQLFDDWLLRRAHWTPRRGDFDEDRLARLLRRFKSALIEGRWRPSGESRVEAESGDRGGKQSAATEHGLTPLG
ncbi:hypothetical protein MPC1_1300004 [Methylocella tundrae]|nr:hypothetical protein MPC1_1300004 [Methylocella tundrae]